MMDGDGRRKKLMKILELSSTPVSGSDLARQLGVSRQVVVQDIALLRADNKQVMSTNKGYILYKPAKERGWLKRVFPMKHATEDTLDELYAIVDFGGRVLDVLVEHELYGQIRVDLIIENRLDAAEFVSHMESSRDLPLKALTGGCHYHTVVAASEKNLEKIEEELRNRGYLI